MVLIVLLIYSQIFVFVQNENTRLEAGAREASQNDLDQTSEQLSISDYNYAVEGDNVSLQALITNDGPIEVEIVTLWVVDTTNQRYAYNDTLNLFLSIGKTLNLTGINAPKVTIENASSSEFVSWFVTSRGNRFSVDTGTGGVIVANVSGGIGSLALDFDNFRHYTYESTTKLANFPEGNTGFDVPSNTYTAFGCYLRNFDSQKRTITIDCHSLFLQPGRSGVGEGAWFIVNVASDGTILSSSQGSFNNITIEYGKESMLVFASSKDLGLSDFGRLRTPNAIATVATNLLLHGTIGSDAFAQNIPYVSLFYD